MNDDFKDVSGLLEEDASKVEGTGDKISVGDKIDIGDKIEIIKPIVPIKPIRMPKLAAMRTMAEYSIPTPVTRKEMYLNVIAGGASALPTPITREEIYLAKICGMDVAIPIPLTRYEMYLYKLAGGEWDVPAPVTRLEIFLYHNCGYEIEVPEPITREEIYWSGGQPVPEILEGVPPLTFTAKRAGALVDYTIYGNTVQSGTPTPDNPVMPEGTGERTGNLVRFYQEEMQGNFYGVDITVKNAEITLNGTVSSGSGHWVEIGYKFGGGTEPTDNVVIPCEPETSYTITTEILDGNSSEVRIISFGTSNTNKNINIGSSLTTMFSADINRIFISLGAGGVVFNNLKFRVMFNKGSTSLPYEPYGIKIPISSAGQTTPIYLGQVQTTRKIKKLVLTGEEGIHRSHYYSNSFVYDNSDISTAITRVFSTHFEGSDTVPIGTQRQKKVFVTNSPGYTYNSIAFGDWQFSGDANAFNAWLAQQYANGTPVIVWYVLATPKTGIVNEPLCKIGDYADSVDFSQAGVEIPVTAGANTLSVGTTIQPSNMMISYK